jgi:hypothetical protein
VVKNSVSLLSDTFETVPPSAAVSRVNAELRASAMQISIDLTRPFLPVSQIMRLLAELVIIAALIFLGWNKPFKEQVAQASTTIESKLHGTGSKLQKNQDPSVKRY